jgi:malate dehydrogenase (quinone)
MLRPTHVPNPEVVLIGSGIMSANLAALLKRLKPELSIQLFEVTQELAQESSDGWNNAGTGHAGICELSYTPHADPDGTVNVCKVIDIFSQFEQSKQFWGYAVASGMIQNPREFIAALPHISFVHGQQQVDFLRARYEGMSAHHFFKSMEYATDRATIGRWAPLLVEGRDPDVPIAATKMDGGTDVNFGAIARKLIGWLAMQPNCGVAPGHRVTDLTPIGEEWLVTVRDMTGREHVTRTRFVFVGAGGGSLPLLQKSGIPEARGIGGFPIGGQWLVCENPAIVERHFAKVYGQALDAAPTMAVPHLDTRFLDGKKTLLFGPFAAWTTKFLHRYGSRFDLFSSVKLDNIGTLLRIGASNVPLVRYLIQQGTQSMADRMEVLHVFYPAAKVDDWKLIDAGIRVQAIKETDGRAGIVHYGTEVVTNQARTISALLGASPGASVSVNIVLEVIKLCFPHLLESSAGAERMSAMIPTWNTDITASSEADRYRILSEKAEQALQLVS